MRAAINDRSLPVSPQNKNNVRAEILKAMLRVIML
jgi:transcriptional regulator CtsR